MTLKWTPNDRGYHRVRTQQPWFWEVDAPSTCGVFDPQGRASSASAPVAHASASLVPSAICRACSSDSAVLP